MPPGVQPPRTSASIGAVIRRSRSGRFTLAQLAKRAGVSSGLLSLIERGQGNPSLETLRRIATALGVEVVELLAAADGVPVPEAGLVRADGSLSVLDGPALPDGWLPGGDLPSAPGRWQSSMVVTRGQEVRVRVLEGALEVRLREHDESAGVRPPLAIDLELRRGIEGDASPIGIPPVDDPRWMELVNGTIPFQPTELAARMLFTHVTRCIESDPSSPNVTRWVSELRGYFVKYEAVSQPEIKRIFG